MIIWLFLFLFNFSNNLYPWYDTQIIEFQLTKSLPSRTHITNVSISHASSFSSFMSVSVSIPPSSPHTSTHLSRKAQLHWNISNIPNLLLKHHNFPIQFMIISANSRFDFQFLHLLFALYRIYKVHIFDQGYWFWEYENMRLLWVFKLM